MTNFQIASEPVREVGQLSWNQKKIKKKARGFGLFKLETLKK